MSPKQERKLARLGDRAGAAVERYGDYRLKCERAIVEARMREAGASKKEAARIADRWQASMRLQPARVTPAEARWLQ
jgi:hypothetical protein